MLAAAGLAVVLLATAGWVVGFTGLLGVRTVAVGGVRSLAPDEVRAAAAVRVGQPLARVDTDAVAERVRRLPGVARVAVARAWPTTLRITVTERRGVAVVPLDGGTWLVEADGVVVQRLASRPKGLPRLDVARAAADDPACRAALAALTALPPPVAAQVLVVAAPTPDSVTFTLTGRRTVLWGGVDEAAAKAAALAALLRRPGRHYDVSTPSTVTVR